MHAVRWQEYFCSSISTYLQTLSSSYRYTWLFYINPNYYGFSSIARLILEDINLECDYHSPIECYPTTGKYLLTYFDLHTVNPFLHILVSNNNYSIYN